MASKARSAVDSTASASGASSAGGDGSTTGTGSAVSGEHCSSAAGGDAAAVRPATSCTTSEGTGIVVWYNDKKGFGFVRPTMSDDSSQAPDIFVHHSAIVTTAAQPRALVLGEQVSYEARPPWSCLSGPSHARREHGEICR